MTGPADLVALTMLESVCFPDSWSERALSEGLANENYLILLERDEGGNALAYLIGWHTGDEAELARIGVIPEARRMGHAKKLLEQGLVRWRERGVQRIFLDVSEVNVAARRLYELSGFQVIGKRRHYYGDGADALVMSLEMDGT